MSEQLKTRPLYGKVILKGAMVCETGLHIGAGGNNLEIGGLDSTVVREPITREPYVPGSSLKGKMRSLMERKMGVPFNRDGGKGIRRHECTEHNCPVCRLFGATGGQEGSDKNIPGRLIIRDMHMSAESKEILSQLDTGLQYTEWKSENSLDRVTAAASPRNVERVPRGTKFNFEIIYTVETKEQQLIKEDIKNLLQVMRLVEDDSLGGSGSRGYGKVRFNFSTFEVRPVNYYAGERSALKKFDVTTVEDCVAVVEEVATYFG